MNTLTVVQGRTYPSLALATPQPSFLRLIQPTSQLGGRPGQIYDNTTREAHDTLRVVFTNRGLKRARWPENEQRSIAPVCKSSNGVTPDPEVLTPFAPECCLCPYEFEKYMAGKRLVTAGRPKPCKRAQTLEVVAAETKKRHILDCGGKSDAPAFWALQALEEIIRKYLEGDIVAPPVAFYFTLSSQRVDGVYAFHFEGPEVILDKEDFGAEYLRVLSRYV